MPSFSAKLKLAIENEDLHWKNVAPSIVISVIYKGHKLGQVQLGEKYKYYDLSSLTKIVFSMSAVFAALKEDRLKLNARVFDYLPWFPSKKTKIYQLLSHSGGLEWWLPLYKKIKRSGDWKVRRHQILKYLKKIKVGRSGKAVYSDIDLWVLGFVFEKIFKSDLNSIFLKVKKNYPGSRLHFCINNKPKFVRKDYAPTEKCPWRKKELQGEVHDDNTWAFGGVSTHAGLFGSINDIETYALYLRKIYRSKKYSQLFLRQNKSDWGLGFMMPGKVNSSTGQYFSSKSVGHLGFTGTSLWYDPQKDLVVIILSNRVNSTRDNNLIRKFRPIVHNTVIKLLSLA